MSERNANGAMQNRSELPPPRFDEHAHLKAQPVTPIPRSRVTTFFENLFANGSRSLAVIIILGFLTGALIGATLVGQNTSAPEPSEQALVVSSENQPPQLDDVGAGVHGVQTDMSNLRSTATRRSRVSNNGQARAYRFAVIR